MAVPSARSVLADLPAVERFWRSRDDSRGVEQLLAFAEAGLSDQAGLRLATETLDRRVVVLLGEPGVGKSTELDGLQSRAARTGVPVQRVDLRGYGDESRLLQALGDGAAARAVAQGTASSLLILDGLDESPLPMSQVSSLIEEGIQDLPAQVHVVVACRTAAWPAALETALRRHAPDLGVFELLPLTRDQVDELAVACGLDPGEFRQAVVAAGVEDLTRTPILLKLLLAEALGQADGAGGLPGSRAELFGRACRRLAADPDPYRGASDAAPPTDDVLTVGGYLAVLGIFGDAAAFWTGSDWEAPDGDLAEADCVPATVARWAGATGVPTEPITLAERHIRQALHTALFAGRGTSRLWFVHQTLGEYLAARALVESGVREPQVRSLLGDRDGLVAPQVQAVAAWLVALRPQQYRALIDNDPTAFVRSGGELTDPAYREVLAAALFELANRHELTHIYDLDLRQVRYPGLADQVARYVADRDAAPDARLLALRAARANNLRALAGDIADLALDERESPDLRSSAASVAFDLDAPTTATQLARLVQSGDTNPEVDPDDQLLGIGLTAVLRAGERPGGVLARLRAPRTPTMFGRYRRLLTQDLPAAVSDPTLPMDDLLDAVRWATRIESTAGNGRPSELVDTAGPVLDSILVTAISRAGEDARLAPAASRLLLDRLGRRQRVMVDRRDRAKLSAPQRHALLEAVIVAATSTDIVWLAGRDLVRPEDLPWLVGRTNAASDPAEVAAWALCAGLAFDPADLSHRRIAAAVAADSLLFREAFARALSGIDQQAADAGAQAAEAGPSVAELRASLADALSSDRADAFAVLCHRLLFQPDQATAQLSLELDVTKLPGWALLEADQREQAARLAVRHLERADVDPAAVVGTNRVDWAVLAGVRALVLLCHTLDRPPHLAPDRWATWVPALVDAPIATGEEPLLQEALVLARQHANQAFVTTARAQACRADTGWIDLRHLAGLLDQSDAPWLVELASDPATPPATASEAFRQALRLAPEQGQQLLTRTVGSRTDDAGRQQATAFAVTAIQADPAVVWPLIWPAMRDDHGFAEQVLLEAAHSQVFDHTALKEDEVAQLWELMNQLFPPEADPAFDTVHAVIPRESAADLRNRLLPGLAERGTDQAIAALATLSAAHPTETWIVQLGAQARRYAVRNRWTPLSPRDLAALLSAPHRFLLRTSGDLLDVVLDVLDQIQDQLIAGPTPEATMLWHHGQNCRGNGDHLCRPRSEDDISDHIARRARDLLPRAVINREVQVHRQAPSGIGERVDILIETPLADPEPNPPRVAIEVKGCWNDEVPAALVTQLADRYLHRLPGAAGLYLVAWFDPAHWKSAGAWARDPVIGDKSVLATTLDQQAAARTTPDTPVAARVLDCSPPERPPAE